MVCDVFPGEYIPTVFDSEQVDKQWIIDGKQITASFRTWDTGGSFNGWRLRPLTYPSADIALICFSRVRSSTLQNVKHKWHPEINHYRPDIAKVLVGTQSDLAFPYDHSLLVHGYIRQLGLMLYLNIVDDIIAIIVKFVDDSSVPQEADSFYWRVVSEYNKSPITEADIDEVMSMGFAKYVETSALRATGIDELLRAVYDIQTLRTAEQTSCHCCML